MPVLFYCLFFKKIRLRTSDITLISYLLLFFLLNCFHLELKEFLGKKNYFFIYTLSEYLFFSTLLLLSIPKSQIKLLIVGLSVLFIFLLVTLYYFTTYTRLDSIQIGVESILILVYIVCFFYFSLKIESGESIHSNQMFWIVIGILVYIAITFFFNILANNLESTEFKKVYYYSYVGDIIKNLLFTFSVIVVLKHVKKVAKTQDKTVPFLDMT